MCRSHQIAYVDNMKSVLLGNNFTVLKPEVQAQLSLAATNLSNYQVSWDDYMLLDGSELWLDQRFGGIDALGAFLVGWVCVRGEGWVMCGGGMWKEGWGV